MVYNGAPMKIPACQSFGNHLEGNPSLCTLQAFLDYGKTRSLTEEEFKINCASSGEHVMPDWD